MLCFGFAVPSPAGGSPTIRFAAAAPLDTAQARAMQVSTDWATAGAPAKCPMKTVDVSAPTGAVTPGQFYAAWRTQQSFTSNVAEFVAMAYQLADDPTADVAQQPDAPSPDPVVLVDDPQGYTTPDGHRYDPPTIGGQPAIPVLRRQRERGWHTALWGEPGSGKTTLAQVAFGDALVQFSFDGGTTDEHLIGQWQPAHDGSGSFEWHDGPLLIAMRQGRPFLADELSRAPHDVQAVLLPVMDHRRRLDVKTNRQIGTVIAAPGFCVIITSNFDAEYGLVDALNDRIKISVTVPTPMATARRLGVPAPLITAAIHLQTAAQDAANNGGIPLWFPGLRTLIDARDTAAEYGLTFAAAGVVSACPNPDQRPDVATVLTGQIGDTVHRDGLIAQPLP